MNTKLTDTHLVIIAIIFLLLVNILAYNNEEGFASNYRYRKRQLRNYRYYDWYDWNYWLYYINPWYPPRQVDLPFEGRNGKISWYEPWNGIVHNY